jgi:hypothetical protein
VFRNNAASRASARGYENACDLARQIVHLEILVTHIAEQGFEEREESAGGVIAAGLADPTALSAPHANAVCP